MAYNNGSPIAAVVQEPPIVSELRSLFASVDDSSLIDALVGPTRRGPKGHPVRVLWQCFLAKYALGLPSTAAMIRMLHNNPFIAQACGINSPDLIPHEATFSRFFARLSGQKYLHLVKNVSRLLVRRHYANLPAFGKRVAMDSTTLKAWSNGGKQNKADKEAGWSIKTGSQGAREIVYGYKLHLLVDCESEMPIAANISAGNVNDANRASHMLSEARHITSAFHPNFVMADKGYSGEPLAQLIKRQYRGVAIIQPNKAHKKLAASLADRMQQPEWKALYALRQAVERVFSRLKGQRSLNHITVRGRRKVTVHCYLALMAMQASVCVR